MRKLRWFLLNKIVSVFKKTLKILNGKLIIHNYYNKKHEKSVLVCYITYPLIKNSSNYHTNQLELIKILECFDNLMYNVDIIDYNNDTKIEFSKYDLIFGFGKIFENSFFDKKFYGIRIFYSTGAEVNWQNNQEIKRILDFNLSHSSNYVPKRLVNEIWSQSYNLSKAMIVIGNSWTLSTFNTYNVNKFSINASGAINHLNIYEINTKRNINKCKKSFLWFGSGGLVLKGLDICIDYFIKNPDLQLIICGPIERDFYDTYPNLDQFKNIKVYGFVNPYSDLFKEIISNCLFSIMPSASEGQSTALITTMSVGLIPIATKYCGIDINSLGYKISDLTVNELENTIKSIPFEDEDYLLNLSNKIITYTNENHNIENFKYSLLMILKKIISE